MNESHYMFVYWIIGTFNNDIETLTLTVGIVRSFESIGSAVSYGLGAAKLPPMTNLIVSFVMFFIAVPATSMVTFLVPDHPLEKLNLLSEDNALAITEDSSRLAAAVSLPVVAAHAGDPKA